MICKIAFLSAVPLTVLLGHRASVSAQTVSGGGQVDAGQLIKFAFTATTLDNGSVIGQAQFQLPEQGVRLHIEIDCLLVVDNIAVMTGVVTNSADPTDVGRTALFAVIDGGEGANGLSDGFTGPFEIRSFLDCDDIGPPPPSFFSPIDAGNIQVLP